MSNRPRLRRSRRRRAPSVSTFPTDLTAAVFSWTTLGAIAGAALFVGACANLGGLGSGSPDAGRDSGARDSSVPPDSTGIDSAALDSGVPETTADTAAADAGVDAPPDAPWCLLQSSPAPYICIDFDEGSASTGYHMGLPVSLPPQITGSATMMLLPDPLSPSPPAHVQANIAGLGAGSGDVTAAYARPPGLPASRTCGSSSRCGSTASARGRSTSRASTSTSPT